MGPHRKMTAASAGILAGIALIQCDGSEDSADAAKSGERATQTAAGSIEAKGFGSRTLTGGLVVEDLVIGDGSECGNPLETVTIHYRGMLEDGREFDSSYARARPIVAPLSGLIQGWQEGVPGMRVGGKRRLTVPSDLAYSGMAAIQPGNPVDPDPDGAVLIPPGATLIFEIELLDVKLTEQALR